jgi:SAM-dependent methyltransferase
VGGRTDSYNISAKHYDSAYAVKQDLADLPFYVELAKRVGGPVLEVGCGTGRVLLNIAREGIQIDGLDNSSPMLRVMRGRLGREPSVVRGKAKLFEGDMRSFRLKKKYPLVIVPFRPMQHMLTVSDQVNALATAALHLRDKGLLAFDVFYPKYERIPAGVGQEILELEWPTGSKPPKTVRRYLRKESFDKIHQNFSATFRYRTYEGGTLTLEETEPLQLSYYTYPHLRTLFLLAGLEPVEEYGTIAKTPLDNHASETIFVL